MIPVAADMYEEVSVWVRDDAQIAVCFTGFRNLATGHVWIAYANWLGIDDKGSSLAREFYPLPTVEYFLTELPSEPEAWRATLAEAVALFRQLNPVGN